jgi:hypothetical protein
MKECPTNSDRRGLMHFPSKRLATEILRDIHGLSAIVFGAVLGNAVDENMLSDINHFIHIVTMSEVSS